MKFIIHSLENGLILKTDGTAANEKEKEALSFVTKHQLVIPFSHTLHALKLMGASGQLFFNDKKLVCDLFGKTEFRVLIKDGLFVAGQVLFRDQWVNLSECDFVCGSAPHWFIKGISLKLINTDLSWKTLKKLSQNIVWSAEEIQELAEEETLSVFYEGIAREEIAIQKDPTPILKLTDRLGSFAELWMDYGNGKLFSFHDHQKAKRSLEAEKQWEKDLLETGFKRKDMATSHYYCPVDQVAKSLTFLLEVGWRIHDLKGNRVVKQTGSDLDLKTCSETVAVRGKIRYEDHHANIQDVAGAFNRRERFVQIGVGTVGLLPQHWEGTGLGGVFDEGEILEDAIHVKRNRLGTLSDVFNSTVQLDEKLSDIKAKLANFSGVSHASPSADFIGKLRPYQQEGLNWLSFLSDHHFAGILADDMGLGKTVQVIAFLSQLSSESSILIVLPTSLLFNWQRELARFLPNRSINVYHGPNRKLSHVSQITITSYSTLRLDLKHFLGHTFDCIILDEAQAIKNAQSQAAQAIYSLKGDFKLAITGTPIENHLGELWSLFRFLIPDLLGDESAFAADIVASGSDSRYLQKIRRQIRPFILRRKKEDVAKDLPEKIEQTVWIEMSSSQREIYDHFLAQVKSRLPQQNRMEIFESILRLRQICCHPLLVSSLVEHAEMQSAKLTALLEDIETIIAEGKKALIYSQFTSMLSLIGKELRERGWKFAYLDGSTTNREKTVDQFQNDPETQLFLISLKAGGVGLNLTAADYVLLYDPWWNAAAEEQAINRAHRIGRKDNVIAKRYVMLECIEERMMKLKEMKSALANDVIDHDDIAAGKSLSADDFNYLLG